EAPSVPARRAVWQAYRNGKAARWLPGLDYEALFEQPLDQVRRRLGIRPATVYHAVPADVRIGLKLRA
ncbi:MAG TPA: ubiquinone biosynthesis protein, partial [Brevundimonas sp.]|nr:ubiquinone biosynthesis protein [Brevundimonas sp.]